MRIFIRSVDIKVWHAIEKGAFIPTHKVDGKEVEKPKEQWTDDEIKLAQYDMKAQNILMSALGSDEFFRVSACETAQEIWETLEVTHEGTYDVKRAKINTLTQEYKLFSMNARENISDMQKRFIYLVNQLVALGKIYQNEDLIHKVLRCLCRE